MKDREPIRRINLIPTPEIIRQSRMAAAKAIEESRRALNLGRPQKRKSEKEKLFG
jgi:hypothetical protein